MNAIGNNTDYIRDQYIKEIEQQLKENPEQTIKEVFEAPIEKLDQVHVSDQPSSQPNLLEEELKRNINEISNAVNNLLQIKHKILANPILPPQLKENMVLAINNRCKKISENITNPVLRSHFKESMENCRPAPTSQNRNTPSTTPSTQPNQNFGGLRSGFLNNNNNKTSTSQNRNTPSTTPSTQPNQNFGGLRSGFLNNNTNKPSTSQNRNTPRGNGQNNNHSNRAIRTLTPAEIEKSLQELMLSIFKD